MISPTRFRESPTLAPLCTDAATSPARPISLASHRPSLSDSKRSLSSISRPHKINTSQPLRHMPWAMPPSPSSDTESKARFTPSAISSVAVDDAHGDGDQGTPGDETMAATRPAPERVGVGVNAGGYKAEATATKSPGAIDSSQHAEPGVPDGLDASLTSSGFLQVWEGWCFRLGPASRIRPITDQNDGRQAKSMLPGWARVVRFLCIDPPRQTPEGTKPHVPYVLKHERETHVWMVLEFGFLLRHVVDPKVVYH